MLFKPMPMSTIAPPYFDPNGLIWDHYPPAPLIIAALVLIAVLRAAYRAVHRSNRFEEDE